MSIRSPASTVHGSKGHLSDSTELEKLNGSNEDLGRPKSLETSVDTSRTDFPLPKWETAKRIGLIVFLSILATVFAVLQHKFLSWIDGRGVDSFKILPKPSPQVQVKVINNFFVVAFAICLVNVHGLSLTNAIWRMVRRHAIRLGNIDDLLSLPSALSMLLLLPARKEKYYTRILWLVFVASWYFGIQQIPIFAPSALSVGVRDETISVLGPALNASNIALDNSADTSFFERYLAPTPEDVWDVPEECQKTGCSFKSTYTAPGTFCQPMDSQQVPLQPFDAALYNTQQNWKFYAALPVDQDATDWNVNTANLTLYYIPFQSQRNEAGNVSVQQTGPIGGQVCNWIPSMVYTANFSYSGGFTSIHISRERPSEFPPINYPSSDSHITTLWNESTLIGGARAISTAFSSAFIGSMMLSDGQLKANPIRITQAVGQIFAYVNNTVDHVTSFEAATPYTTLDMEQLFANATLVLLLEVGDTVPVSAIAPLGNVWVYNAIALWRIYVPSLFINLICAIYGVYCILLEKWPVERKFSAYFIMTRSNTLRELCHQPASILKGTKFRQDQKTGSLLPQIEYKSSSNEPEPVDTSGETEAHPETPLPVNIASKWAVLIITGTGSAAFVLATSHHFFLNAMKGRLVTSSSQYWISHVTNAFAKLNVLLMTASGGWSLTQLTWHALARGKMPILYINFLLHDPAHLSLLFRVRGMLARAAVFLGFLFSYLPVNNLVAPNALITFSGTCSSMNIEMPALDLSVSQSLTSDWDPLILRLIYDSSNVAWPAPSACTSTCSYQTFYQAPALSCRDLLLGEFTVTQNNSSATMPETIYEFRDTTNHAFTEWNSSTPSFLVNYETLRANLSNGQLIVEHEDTPIGVACSCLDGFYHASFNYTSHSISIKSSLLDYTLDDCTGNSPSQECINYSHNSAAICTSFIENMVTRWGWDAQNGLQTPGFQSTYPVIVGWNGTSLTPVLTNPKEDIVQLFSNVTVGLLPKLKQTSSTPAQVCDGKTIWEYKSRLLWVVYAPSLTFIFILAVCALRSIRTLGIAMDKNFSTIMVTTSSVELDAIYNGLTRYEEIFNIQLQYDPSERRFKSGPPSPSSELQTLLRSPIT